MEQDGNKIFVTEQKIIINNEEIVYRQFSREFTRNSQNLSLLSGPKRIVFGQVEAQDSIDGISADSHPIVTDEQNTLLHLDDDLFIDVKSVSKLKISNNNESLLQSVSKEKPFQEKKLQIINKPKLNQLTAYFKTLSRF